jgi:hypothetical protein
MPPSKVAEHLFEAATSSGNFYCYVDNVEDPDYCTRGNATCPLHMHAIAILSETFNFLRRFVCWDRCSFGD